LDQLNSDRMTFGDQASVQVWFRERKCIPDQFNAWLRIISDDDFHDIEAEKDVGIVEHAQPSQGTARNSFLFFPIHCFEWTAEILARARLYFHEYKRVVVAADDVELAAAASFEVAVENLVAVTTQEATR
jgi:hypothetical protein